jgi:hypothetical protein
MPVDRDNLDRVIQAKTRLRKEGDAMNSSTPPKTSYGPARA